MEQPAHDPDPDVRKLTRLAITQIVAADRSTAGRVVLGAGGRQLALQVAHHRLGARTDLLNGSTQLRVVDVQQATPIGDVDVAQEVDARG